MSLTAALARLDADQAAAVTAARAPGGDLRFAAGAGSGKTATLVAMVAALLTDGVAARKMVVVTFTRKAADEMVRRLAAIVGAVPKDMRIGTYHKLAISSLLSKDPVKWRVSRCVDGDADKREAGIPGAAQLWANIVGFGDVRGTSLRGLAIDDAEARDYSLAIGKIRAQGVKVDDADARDLCAEVGLDRLFDVWKMYETAKRELGAFDFDDTLQAWHDSLGQSDNLVIVDEAQDNNPLQLAIARKLARRLILIGDEKQSIYAFRGASPELFAAHPATTLQIRGNYRSGSAIVELGNRIASGQAWASLGATQVAMRPDTGTIGIIHESAPDELADAVFGDIAAQVASGAKYEDHAVLIRTNAEAGTYEAGALRAGIPVQVTGKIAFFDRKEAISFVAYMALRATDSVAALEDAIRRPKRYLGRAFVQAVAEAGKGVDICRAIEIAAHTPVVRGGSKASAIKLAGEIRALRAMEHGQAVDVIEGMIAKAVAPAAADAQEPDEDRSGIVSTCATIARRFDTTAEFLAFVAQCRNNVETGDGIKADRVVVSTLHKAKGLEWSSVYLIANGGTFPHVRADASEESRLYYVGATRARDRLFVGSADVNERGKAAGESQFTARWVRPV
jgi:DNA helicase-2/ATP-dependent DNA helicase PcrA